MNLSNVSWYLSGLLLFGAIVTSAITVAPGGESTLLFLGGGLAGASIAFFVFGLVCRLRLANSRYFNSGLLLRLYVAFAVLTTLLLVFMVLG